MKLADLEPKLNGDRLHFWCPKCNLTGQAHMVGVNSTWGDLTQPLDTMTLAHSVRVVGGCEAHFCINKGEIEMQP